MRSKVTLCAAQRDTLDGQGDALARKVTFSPCKVTEIGFFPLDPVNSVNTPAAQAERLGCKAGMGLNLPAARATMAP